MADERDELDEVMDRAYNGEYALGELIVKARSIRARERKLAELARERYEDLAMWSKLPPSEADWLKRYEEAMK